MKIKINTNKLLYGMFLILFCTKRFWGIDTPWYVNLIVRLFGVFLLILLCKFQLKIPRTIYSNMVLASVPQILIICYTLLLWIVQWNIPNGRVFSNLFTSNLYIILSVLFASVVFYLFGKKGMDLFLKCSFISYFLGSILAILIKFGVKNTLVYLLTSIPPVPGMRFIMEVHDLTFAIGVVFLYYLFFAEKNEGRISKLILSALLIFWGLKRIEIGALVVCCICFKVLIKKRDLRRATWVIGISIFAVCYCYIMAIHTGVLAQLAERFHINFMSRLETYSYVSEHYSKFSLGFPGIGVGYIDEIIEQLSNADVRIGFVPIISLHSDVLRMYIGLGFIGFGVWIYYQTIGRTRIMERLFSRKTTSIYLLLTLYSFILYLTDNTYGYPITYFAINLAVLCTLDDSDNINHGVPAQAES